MKKVCFFGIYNPEYSRNRVLISGFKQNDFDVFECRVDPKSGKIKKYIALLEEYKKIKDIKFDYIIVAFPGHSVVWLAYLLFGKDIIFDAFVSLYDSNVWDRKLYKPFSPRGFRDWFLDWYSCMFAEKILLDTNRHIDYFSKNFKIDKDKFIRVFVGSDNSIFYPKDSERKDKNFVVHFHGSFIPLQGVEYIIESAKILEKEKDIQFNIIGTNIKKKYLGKKFDNINFIENISYEKLSEYMNGADLCLGIFGNTEKADNVIPNKVYEAIAIRKPVITASTLAIKELFEDNESIILCNRADGRDLAQKIIKIKKDDFLREKISNNAFDIFNKRLTPKILVRDLLNDLKK
jgi:glycosyltransferase involved in cell wall biosynthesis